MYAKYTRIFRTPKETPKIHLIYAVFGIDFFIKILPILGTMFSTRTGCFFIRVILIPCNALYVIARHCQIGDPAGYCVLAGKRSTQAKE